MHAIIAEPTPLARRRSWGRPPEWLWALSIALQVAAVAVLTSSAYFFVDDWLFLAQARTEPLSIGYLREPLFEHFSPVSRALDKLLTSIAPGSFGAAKAIELVLFAAALIAFACVVRTLVGNRWLALVLTSVFGQSLFLVRLLTWWTATANLLPATVFSLLAIACYLRWRRELSRRWLAATLLCFVIAVLDYETALLLPAYLVLLVFALDGDVSPRAWAALLRRERWLWLGLVVLEVTGLYNFYSRYYLSMRHPTAGQLLHFLVIALPGTFVPAMMGIKAPESALGHHVGVIVACNALAVAVVAVGIYLRPRFGRCLIAFAGVSLVTMIPLGVNRIAFTGIGVGHELYYQQTVQFMSLLLVAVGCSRGMAGMSGRSPSRARLPRPLVATLAAGAVGGYAVLLVTSADAMQDAYPLPQSTHSYVDTFQASVRRVTKRTGKLPVLLDHAVPEGIVPPGYAPFDNYDQVISLVDPRLRFNVPGGSIFVIDDRGNLVPLRFRPLARGLTNRSTMTTVTGAGRAKASLATRGGACLPRTGPATRLWIPLARSRSVGVTALPFALRVGVTMPRPARVQVVLVGRAGEIPDLTYPADWSAGRDYVFAPLSVRTEVSTVALDLPPGACVDQLVLGTFVVAESAG